jgi:two-component system phosphate regulon sensor histidine kinase PhoR
VLSLALIMTMRVIGREMELARLQTEFAAGVTHEFKSPITSIRLLVERIARGHVVAADSLHEYAAIIDDQAARLEQLVNRLLQAHKMHAANESYHIVPHCLFDIAQNAIERLNAQASAKRIAVHLDADDIAREVPLDGAAIQDSLQNLIDNAIKYSPPDTAIEVKIRHAQDQVSIVVSDRGVGIDKQDLPRVFDRFYRARRGSRQSVTGTGLGLWLVKRAAEGHGGRVDVQSQPGAGSVFCVTIPIHREEEWPES